MFTHPAFNSNRVQFCDCEDCAERRIPPPPVTDEMRATWAAMGLEVTKKPQPVSRKEYKNTATGRRY